MEILGDLGVEVHAKMYGEGWVRKLHPNRKMILKYPKIQKKLEMESITTKTTFFVRTTPTIILCEKGLERC